MCKIALNSVMNTDLMDNIADTSYITTFCICNDIVVYLIYERVLQINELTIESQFVEELTNIDNVTLWCILKHFEYFLSLFLLIWILHWASKETCHFFGAPLTNIHCIKINLWIPMSIVTPSSEHLKMKCLLCQ